MLVQSLITNIESAISNREHNNFSGNITNSEDLLNIENLKKLEDTFGGIFAFIAFHPKTDQLIGDYLQQGSISSDSGQHIFVLFTMDVPAFKPIKLNSGAFEKWITIDKSIHPSYQLIYSLFPNQSQPELPGILFISKFSSPDSPIFVSIGDMKTSNEVGSFFRKVFKTATKCFLETNGTTEKFTSKFGTSLAIEKIKYQHVGPTSMKEWLVKAFFIMKKNLGDIVTVVGLFK